MTKDLKHRPVCDEGGWAWTSATLELGQRCYEAVCVALTHLGEVHLDPSPQHNSAVRKPRGFVVQIPSPAFRMSTLVQD